MWETRRVFQADGGNLQGYPQERHVHSCIYKPAFARLSTHEIEIHMHEFYNHQYFFLYSAIGIRSSHFKKTLPSKNKE
jgi:hypothetical protein